MSASEHQCPAGDNSLSSQSLVYDCYGYIFTVSPLFIPQKQFSMDITYKTSLRGKTTITNRKVALVETKENQEGKILREIERHRRKEWTKLRDKKKDDKRTVSGKEINEEETN